MKVKEARELDGNALLGKIVEAKTLLARQKAGLASRTGSEKPGKLKATRKSIARMLTIARERELGIKRSARK